MAGCGHALLVQQGCGHGGVVAEEAVQNEKAIQQAIFPRAQDVYNGYDKINVKDLQQRRLTLRVVGSVAGVTASREVAWAMAEGLLCGLGMVL